MTEKTRETFWQLKNPMLWGLGATTFIVLTGAGLGFLEACSNNVWGGEICVTKWKAFLKATPNEVGDTLAGFAGALAFVWIIVTVAMQSIELGEQRKVLALQKDEMEMQREATEDMARAMAAQAKIFEDEQRHRLEEKTAYHVSQLLETFEDRIHDYEARKKSAQLYWEYERDVRHRDVNGNEEIRRSTEKIYVFEFLEKKNREAIFKSCAKSARKFRHFILVSYPGIEIVSVGRFQEETLGPLIAVLQEIDGLSDSLSVGERARLRNLGVYEMLDVLSATIKEAKKLEGLVREYIS